MEEFFEVLRIKVFAIIDSDLCAVCYCGGGCDCDITLSPITGEIALEGDHHIAIVVGDDALEKGDRAGDGALGQEPEDANLEVQAEQQ